MQFKHKLLDFTGNHLFIMGILNVTPDSFSDGGKFMALDKALFQAEKMIKEGAAIIDVGGESTRPYSTPMTEAEELDRVIPVIEKINRNFETIISIDTYKSKTAEEALKYGAEIINDISGFSFDPLMKSVCQKYQAKAIVMHIKGTPQNMQNEPFYKDLISEVYTFLERQIIELKTAGINDIIADVGFGFGKSLEHNYLLLQRLNHFTRLGCPLLAGISRKSMIGKVAGTNPDNRLPGTIALNSLAIINGASILRVHDVAENYQVIQVLTHYLTVNNIQ